MAKSDGLLPKFLHFQTKIKYTEDQNIKVQLENVTDHDWAEVVKCKDCYAYQRDTELAEADFLDPKQYCALLRCEFAPDGFCSYGRRAGKNAG